MDVGDGLFRAVGMSRVYRGGGIEDLPGRR